jgi:cytoskeletal protein CcmA (bactofilin family)
MQAASVIGQSITIKGDINSDEPLTIAGRVDGTIRVNGHSLTIDGAGHVNADVQADSIVVAGQVTGALVATTRLVVRETATVEATLTAPVLSVADGAEIRGRIDVAGRKKDAALKLAS